MEIDVKDLSGAKVGTVVLPADIFEAPINKDLMHQALVRQQANARLGTHETKTRGQVAGGGKKPFKQKGTGHARQGSTRAPHWKGGGKVHTPHMHSHDLSMPRQMRRGALRSALSVKASEGQVVIVDKFIFDAPKTKTAIAALSAIGAGRTSLIVLAEASVMAQKSLDNLKTAKTLNARYLNVRDLLGYETLILPLAALDVIKDYLGEESAE
jgi:large subunit ribosomal protein L4